MQFCPNAELHKKQTNTGKIAAMIFLFMAFPAFCWLYCLQILTISISLAIPVENFKGNVCK